MRDPRDYYIFLCDLEKKCYDEEDRCRAEIAKLNAKLEAVRKEKEMLAEIVNRVCKTKQ